MSASTEQSKPLDLMSLRTLSTQKFRPGPLKYVGASSEKGDVLYIRKTDSVTNKRNQLKALLNTGYATPELIAALENGSFGALSDSSVDNSNLYYKRLLKKAKSDEVKLVSREQVAQILKNETGEENSSAEIREIRAGRPPKSSSKIGRTPAKETGSATESSEEELPKPSPPIKKDKPKQVEFKTKPGSKVVVDSESEVEQQLKVGKKNVLDSLFSDSLFKQAIVNAGLSLFNVRSELEKSEFDTSAELLAVVTDKYSAQPEIVDTATESFIPVVGGSETGLGTGYESITDSDEPSRLAVPEPVARPLSSPREPVQSPSGVKAGEVAGSLRPTPIMALPVPDSPVTTATTPAATTPVAADATTTAADPSVPPVPDPVASDQNVLKDPEGEPLKRSQAEVVRTIKPKYHIWPILMYFGSLEWNKILDTSVLINIFFGSGSRDDLNTTIDSIVKEYNDKLLLVGRRTKSDDATENLKIECNEMMQLVKFWKRSFVKPGTKALVNTADLRQLYSTANRAGQRPVEEVKIEVEQPVIKETFGFVSPTDSVLF